MTDFFISYNKADKDYAEWIAWTLEEAGYTVIIQAWDFRPGGNFALKMQQAATGTLHTLAVLSQAYLEAAFTQSEWASAFVQDPTGEKGILIPVRVRDCELTGILRPIIYIDLLGKSEEEATQELLEGVKQGRAKPPTKPPYPMMGLRVMKKRPPFPAPAASNQTSAASNQVWNVPLSRNPNFTGRTELLKALRKSLESGRFTALTALHGLGGVGKTQTALEYAYRHRQDYRVVWWIRSEEPATLASDYAALAAELDLAYREVTDQHKREEAVKKWLEANPDWLLVFDNTVDEQSLSEYLPKANTGHVLITSRNPVWDGAEPLSVHKFKRSESIKYLLHRTKSDDEKSANHLAGALGDLPLALAQAAAYVAAAGSSLAEYLALFQSRGPELLKHSQPPQGYDATVLTTWNISVQKVGETEPAAVDLLRLLAFFAPDDIPKGIIAAGAEFLPESLAEAVKDPLKYNDLIAALRRYSLIEAKEDSLSVHRLTQMVTRSQLAEEEQNTWIAVVAHVVNEAFPANSDDVRTWDICKRLLPHALLSAEQAESHELALDSAARLWNQCGEYSYGLADYKNAREHFEWALRIDEKTYGPDHPKVAIRVNNLGIVLRAMDDLPEAKEYFERALRIDEKAYGPDHPKVGVRVNNLGGVALDLGDLPEAKEYFERALHINEKAYGPDHPMVATHVNNLGNVLQALGDLPGAKKQLERALRIDEKVYGPDHPEVAIDINNLGTVLKDLGDLVGARKHLERALRIQRLYFEENHPNIQIVLDNLASLGEPQ